MLAFEKNGMCLSMVLSSIVVHWDGYGYSSKPHRSKVMDTWVLHSTVAWATANLNISEDAAIRNLIQEAERATNCAMAEPCVARAHRWLYSRPTESLKQNSLWDEMHRLVHVETGAVAREWKGH